MAGSRTPISDGASKAAFQNSFVLLRNIRCTVITPYIGSKLLTPPNRKIQNFKHVFSQLQPCSELPVVSSIGITSCPTQVDRLSFQICTGRSECTLTAQIESIYATDSRPQRNRLRWHERDCLRYHSNKSSGVGPMLTFSQNARIGLGISCWYGVCNTYEIFILTLALGLLQK